MIRSPIFCVHHELPINCLIRQPLTNHHSAIRYFVLAIRQLQTAERAQTLTECADADWSCRSNSPNPTIVLYSRVANGIPCEFKVMDCPS